MRRYAAATLVVLTCILALLSAIAMWLRTLVLDTDAYVRAIAPVLDRQDVRDALATDIIDALYDHVDVTKLLRQSLPRQAAQFAPTLAASIRETSTRLASTALGTPAVRHVWKDANRIAHQQVVRVLEGKGKIVTTKGGEVAVDTGALAQSVLHALDDAGIHVFDSVNPKVLGVRFVLFKSTDLEHAQQATRILDDLATWLPFVTIGVGVGAVVCAHHRRRTLEYLAIGIAAAMVLIIVGVAVGRAYYLNAVGHTIAHPIAAAPFDALVVPLRAGVRIAFVAALLVWAGSWISSSRSILVREEKARAAALEFIKHYARMLAIGGAIAAAVMLVAWDRPRPLTVIAILVALAVWEALVLTGARHAPPPAV